MAGFVLRIISKFPQTFLLSGSSGVTGVCVSRIQSYSIEHTQDGNQSNEKDNNGEDNMKVDNVREKILSASLPFVLEKGWTRKAISAGAESIGYPGIVHGMFPRGGVELVQYFYVDCNRQLKDRLLKEEAEVALDPTKKLRTSEFFQEAVEIRLRMIVPYLEVWPQAIGILSLPPNVPTTLANLLTLVDDICYYAGDRSVDFGWYSRRVALAGIYKLTEVYLVQDKSNDYEQTWQFLARRMEDAVYLNRYLEQSEEMSLVAKETVTSAFITARNILGLNLGNR